MKNKIENKEEFIDWAKRVNGSGPQCDLQDEFARSDISGLKEFFMDMDRNEKELLVFSIGKCMGSAELMEFVSAYARRKAEEYIESEGVEIDSKWTEVLQKEIGIREENERLKDTIKGFEDTIKNFEHQIKINLKQNTMLRLNNSDLNTRINELESDLGWARDRIAELEVFEAHIKRLLKED